MRTLPTAVQGSAFTREGVSWHMRNPDTLQGPSSPGRGLSGACAHFYQHCRTCFTPALVWHLPESSRAVLGGGIPGAVGLPVSPRAPPLTEGSIHKCSFSEEVVRRQAAAKLHSAPFCSLTTSNWDVSWSLGLCCAGHRSRIRVK